MSRAHPKSGRLRHTKTCLQPPDFCPRTTDSSGCPRAIAQPRNAAGPASNPGVPSRSVLAAIDALARAVPRDDPLAVMVESVFVGGRSVGSWPHVVRHTGWFP